MCTCPHSPSFSPACLLSALGRILILRNRSFSGWPIPQKEILSLLLKVPEPPFFCLGGLWWLGDGIVFVFKRYTFKFS